jgi:tRNA pseudouridine32 synthase/23S rRNA pseudouridine746 synthase
MREGRREPGALPLRDGLSASSVALPPGPWATILDFLCARFAHIDRAIWLQRLRDGHISTAAGLPVSAATPYRPAQTIHYYRHLADEAPIPVQETILFQDEWLVVADKPHFLPVVPGGRFVRETLLTRLRAKLSMPALTPLHRIDRETAGLVVFCVQPATRQAYHCLFRERAVHKVYHAVAPLRENLPLPMTYRSRLMPATRFPLMEETAGPPNAETRIDLLAANHVSGLGLYQLEPLTGRTHQLRVQMAALGIPIVHDTMYPVLQPADAPVDYQRPLQLLAQAIAFDDPLTGQRRAFASEHSVMSTNQAG